MARVLISMPERFLDEIDKVAGNENRTRSELIREALRTYMFLCDCWMQSRDNSVEEMREYLQKEMIALCEKANGCDLTEGKGK